MISWLWLIPALPFFSATLLILFGSTFAAESCCRAGRGIHRTLSPGHSFDRG